MPLDPRPESLPPHVVKVRQLTRRCVKLQLVSLETEPSVDVGEEGLLVIFSTQASQVTSTWNRCGWSRPHIEIPACEVTVLSIKVDYNETESVGTQGPIQWFVEDQSVRYRYGLNDPIQVKLLASGRRPLDITLITRVEERPSDLAVNVHKEWITGSVGCLLLDREPSIPVVPAVDPLLPTVPIANDEEAQAFLERYFYSFPGNGTSDIMFMSDGRILKYGRKVHLHEAFSLQFIRERTSIPVPVVHLAFEARGITFIVMEKVEGESLDALLEDDSIDQALPESIAKELVGYMEQIQNIVPPSSPDGRLFGSFPSGPYDNVYFDPPPPRRYKYIEELSMYLVSMTATNPVPPALLRVGQQVPAVLAHGDLNPSNIIVKDGRISGIVDWDAFGSYPPWWEYMRAIRPFTRWDSIIRKEMDQAMKDGRIIDWNPADDLAQAYFKHVALILLKQERGHFGGA